MVKVTRCSGCYAGQFLQRNRLCSQVVITHEQPTGLKSVSQFSLKTLAQEWLGRIGVVCYLLVTKDWGTAGSLGPQTLFCQLNVSY